jgi:hypothetical protein
MRCPRLGGRLGTLGLAVTKMVKNSEKILVKMVVYHILSPCLSMFFQFIHLKMGDGWQMGYRISNIWYVDVSEDLRM